MNETQCPKCSMPWCDHVGDGHDEPICPTKPEHRCPSCERDALRAENAALREALETIRKRTQGFSPMSWETGLWIVADAALARAAEGEGKTNE